MQLLNLWYDNVIHEYYIKNLQSTIFYTYILLNAWTTKLLSSMSFIIYQIQLDLAFITFDIWLILRESLYFSCRTSNLFFLLLSTKKVDGYSNTHVYIYSSKPVFSRQTDQTDCTVNSGICNQFFLYHWLRNKMTNLTFDNYLTLICLVFF